MQQTAELVPSRFTPPQGQPGQDEIPEDVKLLDVAAMAAHELLGQDVYTPDEVRAHGTTHRVVASGAASAS